MVEAYCPGHVTLFFSPRRADDLLRSGSVGAGIKTRLGSSVSVEERADTEIKIFIDGEEGGAAVTRAAVRSLARNRGFDIHIDCDLPASQGFGMSASGTIAAGVCVCAIAGRDPSDAYVAAHVAEIENGGGLGDVAAIISQGHQPTRETAGLPPHGIVTDSGMTFDLTLAVIGPPLHTGDALSDKTMSRRIEGSGTRCLKAYMEERTEERLFSLARDFSASARLETPAVTEALERLPGRSAMCMLGHSIITTASADEVRDILPEARIFPTASFGQGPIIRKG